MYAVYNRHEKENKIKDIIRKRNVVIQEKIRNQSTIQEKSKNQSVSISAEAPSFFLLLLQNKFLKVASLFFLHQPPLL